MMSFGMLTLSFVAETMAWLFLKETFNIEYDEVDFKFEDIHQPEQKWFTLLMPNELEKT